MSEGTAINEGAIGNVNACPRATEIQPKQSARHATVIAERAQLNQRNATKTLNANHALADYVVNTPYERRTDPVAPRFRITPDFEPVSVGLQLKKGLFDGFSSKGHFQDLFNNFQDQLRDVQDVKL